MVTLGPNTDTGDWDILGPSVNLQVNLRDDDSGLTLTLGPLGNRVSVGKYRRIGKEPIRNIQIRDKILTLRASIGKEIWDIIAELEASLGVKVSDDITVIEAELSREHIKEAIEKYLGTDDTALEPEDYVKILKKIKEATKR